MFPFSGRTWILKVYTAKKQKNITPKNTLKPSPRNLALPKGFVQFPAFKNHPPPPKKKHKKLAILSLRDFFGDSEFCDPFNGFLRPHSDLQLGDKKVESPGINGFGTGDSLKQPGHFGYLMLGNTPKKINTQISPSFPKELFKAKLGSKGHFVDLRCALWFVDVFPFPRGPFSGFRFQPTRVIL